MMIDLTCSPEVVGIIEYLAATGIPHRVTSTWRPGAITAAGNPSRHGRKLAVDFGGPRPGRDSEDLADIFHAFLPVEHSLNELIYAGPQVRFNIKRGQRVAKYAQRVHHDHVHVAVDQGVILLEAPMAAALVERPVEAPPEDTDGREDMADPVDALVSPEGGVWVLTRDGGVRTYDDTGQTPFHGSYPALPEVHRNDPNRTFVEILARDDGAPGYMLRSAGGELYRFP